MKDFSEETFLDTLLRLVGDRELTVCPVGVFAYHPTAKRKQIVTPQNLQFFFYGGWPEDPQTRDIPIISARVIFLD